MTAPAWYLKFRIRRAARRFEKRAALGGPFAGFWEDTAAQLREVASR